MNGLGKSILVAGTAATLLLSGSVVARATDKKGDAVKCSGVNACKGQGACAGAGHSCKGQNGCKGQGWVETGSEKECTDKGGKVVK